MTDNPYQFNRETWPPSATATRFEAGSPNMLGQVAMHASVGLLLQIGMQHVESYIADNSRILSESLAGLEGFELVRPFDPQRVSGIVSFRPPDRDPQRLHRLLKEQQLTCAVRGDAIRLSPHFYQSGEPIQKILTVIELAFT
jgi:selenocysteine lyase/cysteine desulfurase